MRYDLFSWVLTSLIILTPTVGVGQVQEAEFNGLSAWELSLGEALPTDCSIEWTNPKTGRIYCFASETAKANFERDAEENAKKAGAEYRQLAN